MPAERHPLRGYLAIAGAAFCWGGAATLGKLVFTGRLLGGAVSPINPLILAQTRTTFSLLVLAPLLLMLRGRSGLSLPRADVALCFIVGVVGVAASNFLYYFAIEKTTVATAIILQYTAPVWVLLYLVARRQQRATLPRVLSVAAAVAGCALAIGVIGGQARLRLNTLGVLAAEGAALSFAFYNVFGHGLVARFDRWRVLTYVLLGAVLFWLVVNPPWKIAAAHYSGAQWAFLFVFACVSVLLPFSLYFAGLQYLDATRAIVTSCLEPVFAILFAATFVAERLLPWQIFGVVLVVVATVIVQLPERRGEAPATDPTLAMGE
ncbi:MAG TPA: DMT family transporter [Terriglobales bacterium]|nr:DMT family transporter [Terriglobales bacterium]